MKSSNNTDYRVNPIFGFLEARGKAELELLRAGGQPKADKLVVQWAYAEATETDPRIPFAQQLLQGELLLPIRVVP